MDAAVTDAESGGSVKVMLTLASPDVITEGETVKVPVMDGGGTTDTVTFCGCPVVPVCTATPERLGTRSEYVVTASGLTSNEAPLARLTLPPPPPTTEIVLVTPPVNVALS